MNLMQIPIIAGLLVLFLGFLVFMLIRAIKRARKAKDAPKNHPVRAKDRLDNEFYVKCPPADDSTIPMSIWQRRKYEKFKQKHPDTFVLARMEMSNGNWREFLVNEKNDAFYLKDKQFLFDNEMRYYIIERNLWAYDFNEKITLPYKRRWVIHEKLMEKLIAVIDTAARKPMPPRINVNELNELIEGSQIIDVQASMNPKTQKRFSDSEIVKQVLQGAMLGRILKVILIILIIIGILALIILIIVMYQSQVFEKLGHLFGKK